MARGAASRGKRVAFGDGKRIYWDHNSPLIFKNNPNLAPPGSEAAGDLEWIDFRKGHRHYNSHDVKNNRWVWNYEFKAKPGELFFDEQEKLYAHRAVGQNKFIVIEPNVPWQKMCSPNKQWGHLNYEAVAKELVDAHFDVVQFVYQNQKGYRLRHGRAIPTPTFRHGLAVMRHAKLYVGPEGGLHHGAAAVGVPGVVLFGGFIPPQVTGYDTHTNLTGGAQACGSLKACRHCKEAMEAISVENVLEAIGEHIQW